MFLRYHLGKIAVRPTKFFSLAYPQILLRCNYVAKVRIIFETTKYLSIFFQIIFQINFASFFTFALLQT
jgi:hypothetical protein